MKSSRPIETVLVTGGAGYVGAVTVPKLIEAGYKVRVYDLYLYGDHVFDGLKKNKKLAANLEEIKGDIRDQKKMDQALRGVDAVIHLACISNDPSYELNPSLGRSINYDAFVSLVRSAKRHGAHRFVFASSSSVYGVKADPHVTEDLPLQPMTDYSKYKALCEEELLKEATDEMTSLVVRPSTVCGYSPRLRLDLTVNILTNFAVNKGEILVYGGDQRRPNLHIEDMAEFYLRTLQWPHEKIHRKIFNVGHDNHTVNEIAKKVRKEIGDSVKLRHEPAGDDSSYHVSSERIGRELGFKPKHTVDQAIRDLREAFKGGLIPNSFTDSKYFNIKRMQELNLQ